MTTTILDSKPYIERSVSMAEAYSLYDNGEIDSKTLRSLSISYAQTSSVCCTKEVSAAAQNLKLTQVPDIDITSDISPYFYYGI